MRFFITNSLPEYIDLISSATPFARKALAKDEVKEPLRMTELDSLRKFKQHTLIIRLTQAKQAA